MEIIPGILEKEWSEIERKIDLVKPFARTIHVDLLDGKFVNNTTFLDPLPFKKYTGSMLFELHMMVEEPIQYLKSFADVGFRRFLGHVEKMSDQVAFVATAEQLGEVGLVLDGPTGLDAIKVPYQDLDCLLFYTSEKVGFSGPPFKPERLEKVKKVTAEFDVLPLEVDGGINDQTILLARDAGATRFVTTSFLFKENTPKEQYQTLRSCLG